MRAATESFGRAVAQGARSQVEITAWLGARRLATLPVIRNSWSVSDSEDQVPGALSFQVPNTAQWRPATPSAPLGAAGQRYHVRAGLTIGKSVQWVSLGWTVAKPAQPNGDVIDCSGVGLLDLVNRAKLLSPLTVAAGASRKTVVRSLAAGILPMIVTVTDEAMAAWTCEQDRLQGLWDMADAWPARLDVSDAGMLLVRPPWADTGTAVVELVDGEDGTVSSVTLAPQSSDDMHNAYKVTSVPQGDTQPVSESWSLTTGPWRWGGPYGYAPGFYEDAALNGKTRAQMKAIARQMTLRSLSAAQAWTVTAAPDPRVQKGDIAHVRSSKAGIDMVGRITAVTHTSQKLECTVARMGDAS